MANEQPNNEVQNFVDALAETGAAVVKLRAAIIKLQSSEFVLPETAKALRPLHSRLGDLEFDLGTIDPDDLAGGWREEDRIRTNKE